MPKILSPTPEAILKAAELIRGGKLVAFPTETVYGLGGDASNDLAVAAIFEAKGRPSFNPLIVHVPNLEAALALADFPPKAVLLAKTFWPGPLTMVLRRRPGARVSELASAGLETIAIRVPAHPVALDLLAQARCPVAAPSANPSGRISPTTAQHVAKGLGGKTAMILDGGPCGVGLESAVLSLVDDKPLLLRPGGVTKDAIEAVIGAIEEAPPLSGDDTPQSPGQLASHYAPGLPVRLEAVSALPGEAFLAFGPLEPPGFAHVLNLSPSGNLTEAAARLFSCLHELDRAEFSGIAIAPIPEEGLGLAINDRLRRAAAPR
jgi:L-threonylcarbamoyladenylate synthase